MTLSRRSMLAMVAAGTALPAAAEASVGSIAFRHGVASGDPSASGAILWTRVSPIDEASAAPIGVEWFVSDRDGGRPVASGRIEARASRDYTVKVEAKRLKPGREYWYWFAVREVRSPVGRFRTLPKGATTDAVLAVVSCQLYSGGYFNAYRAIAELERLDAVVHLGDYIYEYSTKDYGAELAARLGRVPEPAHECVTLADYRRRHAHYKLDADMQAAHARAAFIPVWDDHETTNDSWVDGAENHQPEAEGDWRARKAAALQAYFEWMPIRDPAPGKPLEAINRSFHFGDLATLLMVETRLLARSKQAAPKGTVPGAAALDALKAEVARPEREMLGTAQRAWLARELQRSAAAGKPWQVIGNQIIMARVMSPDLEKALGAERFQALLEKVRPSVRRRMERSLVATRAGVPLNLDGWDGYPAARERLYDAFIEAGSRPIVLSGDSHAFWANDLLNAQGRLVAAEFGTSSITSPSVGDALPGLPLGSLIAQANDEVAFCDQSAKGYVLLTLTRGAARADYMAVSTILSRDFRTHRLASFSTKAGPTAGRLQRAS